VAHEDLEIMNRHLPKLTEDELMEHKARVDFLSRGLGKKAATDLANEELLYKLITNYCPSMGLYRLRKDPIYDRFKNIVIQLQEGCKRFDLNPHESRDFYRLIIHLVVITLQKKQIAVHFNTVIYNLKDIWALLETAFPGYGTRPDFFKPFVLEPFVKRKPE
jgi:hypothetical protein